MTDRWEIDAMMNRQGTTYQKHSRVVGAVHMDANATMSSSNTSQSHIEMEAIRDTETPHTI